MFSYSNDCSREILGVTPIIKQAIQTEMLYQRENEVSVPKFQTLRFISKFPDKYLQSVAERLSIPAPSATNLVHGLVYRPWMIHQTATNEHLADNLNRSDLGRKLLDKSFAET